MTNPEYSQIKVKIQFHMEGHLLGNILQKLLPHLMMALALHMAPMVERHQTDLEEHSQKQMKAKLKY